MKLVVGLGNPGEKYVNTRHNVGYLLCNNLDNLSKKSSFVIRKSNKFMNDSGSFVSELIKRYGIELKDLYIIHDDLDIALGLYKIQFAKGPKDHNGLNDIYEKLGTKDFWHVRVGIDNRDLGNKTKGEEYVLQDFTSEEKQVLKNTLEEICKKLVTS